MEGVQPGMDLSGLPAGQSDPDCSIQPAGTLRQAREERLAQKEALPSGSHRPEPQFASLVSPVQYNSPGERRPFLAIPFEHSDELLS
jgi:hypothetical protein